MAQSTRPPQSPPTQPKRPSSGANGARPPSAAPGLSPLPAQPLPQRRGLGQLWHLARATLKGQFIALMVLILMAIGNETYPEEREPLGHIQQDWNTYAALDPQIRQRATANNPNRLINAETFSTGASNQAFGVFTNTIDRLSDANRAYYNHFYANTDAALSREIFLSAVLFPLIGLAALWGLYGRLKDL